MHIKALENSEESRFGFGVITTYWLLLVYLFVHKNCAPHPPPPTPPSPINHHSSSPPSATTILTDDADNTVVTSTLAPQTETAVSSTASLITTVDANVQGNSTLSNSTSTSQPVGGQVLLPKTLLPTKCPAKDVLISLKVGYLSAKVVLPNNDIMELPTGLRSEERRVGKECRSRWSPYH